MMCVRTAIALSLLTVLPAARAAADPVTRRSADLYATDDGSVAYATAGCTQTARSMEARVETNSVTGRPHLVFYDALGEEEADCPVVMVASRPRVPEGKRGPIRVAVRTRQTARRR